MLRRWERERAKYIHGNRQAKAPAMETQLTYNLTSDKVIVNIDKLAIASETANYVAVQMVYSVLCLISSPGFFPLHCLALCPSAVFSRHIFSAVFSLNSRNICSCFFLKYSLLFSAHEMFYSLFELFWSTFLVPKRSRQINRLIRLFARNRWWSGVKFH